MATQEQQQEMLRLLREASEHLKALTFARNEYFKQWLINYYEMLDDLKLEQKQHDYKDESFEEVTAIRDFLQQELTKIGDVYEKMVVQRQNEKI